MPFGRYPERVKDFTKWSRGQVEKAKLSGSATSTSRRRTRRRSRKTSRSQRRLKREQEE